MVSSPLMRANTPEENEDSRLLPVSIEVADQPKPDLPEEKHVGCFSWKGEAAINFIFIKRLWRLLCILKAFPAVILPLLAILNAHVVSRSGKLTGKFYSVFLDMDKSGFYSVIVHAAVIFTLATTVYSVMNLLADGFAFLWRKKLTIYLMNRYTHADNFYWMRSIDNPDQRIAQDLHQWCLSISKLLRDLAAVPYNVIYYTWQTHKVLKSYKVLLAVYVWFIGGAIFLKFLIGPSANLIFTQDVWEGNFRSALMRLKRYRTEIAGAKAEEIEREHLRRPFNNVLFYQIRVVFWDFLIAFVSKTFDYMGSLLNYTCIGFVIFSGGFGEGTSGDMAEKISNTSFYLLMLIYSFSQVQDASKTFSELAGLTPRVAQLIEHIDGLDTQTREEKTNGSQAVERSLTRLNEDDPDALKIHHFSCWTPGTQLIVNNLNLHMRRGESLLILGPSGVGKSTFLLTLMGLYESYKGGIETLPSNCVMLLPQQAVVAPGKTLRSQLAYPKNSTSLPYEAMMELLAQVGLDDAVFSWCGSDLSVEKNWNRVFSAGQLQRIALARAILHKPDLLFLDESTSALPPDTEEDLYSKVKQNGTTIVSVGHNASLGRLHDWILTFHGDQQGQWTLTRQTESFSLQS